MSHVQDTIKQHIAVATFLSCHVDVLDSLSYDVMAEKLGESSWSDRVPYVDFYTYPTSVDITAYGPDQKDTMRTLRRAIGGKWDKKSSSYQFSIQREYEFDGTEITISIVAGDREQVCQKVVVSVEQVEVPAREAHTESREVVDWVCGDLLK